MNFTGFSIPDGAYLPPEVIYLLPNITGAKLKIILAVLYTNLQFGAGETLSFNDIQRLTGLKRPTVNDSLSELLSEGFLERIPVGNSFSYAPVVRFFNQPQASEIVKKSNYLPQELRESDRELNINLKDSLSDSLNLTTGENEKKILLTKALRSAGVYLKTAQGIVEQHDATTIDQHLDYYRYALEKNLAQGPGWLVLSLKEGWQAPIGYQPTNHREARELPADYDPLQSRFALCIYCNNDPCTCGKEAFYRCSECGDRPCECGAEAYKRI